MRIHNERQPISNYAFKRTAELALRSKQTIAPQPLNAALALMKKLVVIVGLSLTAPMVVAHADQESTFEWPSSHVVSADLNRSGKIDFAQLGIGTKSVGLKITIDSRTLPVIHIPIDGSKQFGICPGSTPSISVDPHSEAPLNALGDTPRGYEICSACFESVVSGGECDSIHFYWDTISKEVSWWRA